MAGIVQSFLGGMRQARQDQADQAQQDWLAQQRAWTSGRQQVQADQTDAKFAHDSGRWAGDDAYTDRTRKFNIDSLQHTQDRQPIVDQQTDSNFALNQQAAKQRMQLANNAEGRAETTFNQAQQDRALLRPNVELTAKLGLSDLQQKQIVQQARVNLSNAAHQAVQSNDPSTVVDWMNQTFSPTSPNQLLRGQDGKPIQDGYGNYIVMSPDGSVAFRGDMRSMLQHANAMSDPDTFWQGVGHGQTKADPNAAALEAAKTYRTVAGKADGSDPMEAADQTYLILTGEHLPKDAKAALSDSHAGAAGPSTGSVQAAVGATGGKYKTPQDVRAAYQSGAFGDPKTLAARAKAKQILTGMGFTG